MNHERTLVVVAGGGEVALTVGDSAKIVQARSDVERVGG